MISICASKLQIIFLFHNWNCWTHVACSVSALKASNQQVVREVLYELCPNGAEHGKCRMLLLNVSTVYYTNSDLS